jgi:hypothetical protein
VIIGHIVYGLGFFGGIGTLIYEMLDGTTHWSDFLTRMILLLVLGIAAFMQKSITRQILGIATFEIYGLLLFQYHVFEGSTESNRIPLMILFQGLYLILLLVGSHYWSIVPKLSVLILGFVPFVVQLVLSAITIYDQEVALIQIGAYCLYSGLLYAIAHFHFRKEYQLYGILLKILGFTIVAFLLLVDVSVGLEHFGYGILFFGIMIYGIHYFEPDRNAKIMKIFEVGIRFLWLGLFLIYMFAGIDTMTFNMLAFMNDFILLVILFGLLNMFTTRIPLTYRMGINVVAFMIITYQNLNMTSYGNGIMTLLWAAYGLALLAWSVVKASKGLIKLALIMIVIIAAKFVIVDLSTVSTLWKILVSMIFGTALLILSYFLQPILSRDTE